TFSANTGYHFDSLRVDGVKINDSTSSYSFVNVTGDHSIQSYNSINHYTITSSSVNGSVSPEGSSDVTYGEQSVFTFSPNAGYHFDSLKVDGVTVLDSTLSYSFLNISANHSLVVYNSKNSYTISASAVNGSITPSGSISLFHGADTSFTFSPNSGYHLDSLVVDGVKVDSTVSYTFIGVTSSHSIIAYNSVNHYTVTASSVNGSVTPAGAIDVIHGTTHSFAFSPNTGYHLDSVRVDGALVDSTVSYTFITIGANHTIEVFNSIDHFTLTASAVNGTITPEGVTDVVYGSAQSFTFAPNSGNHLDSVKVDGVRVDSLTSYTFSSISANHTITVYNSIDHFSITSSASNGSITPVGSSVVAYGGDLRFHFTPNTGYHFDSLVVDGVRVNDSTTAYSFINVTNDHSITAFYSINQYSIIVAVGPNGSVSPNDTLVVLYGRDTTVTFNADLSYHVDTVAVNGVRVDSLAHFTFTNVVSDQSVRVAFATNPLHHFTVEKIGGGSIGQQTAGNPFSVEVKARDSEGNILNSFAQKVVFSSQPAGAVFIGGDTSAVFTNGILSAQSVRFNAADSFAVKVKKAPGGPELGISNTFFVHHAAAHHMVISSVFGTMAGLPLDSFAVTVKDTFNNVARDYIGSVTLTKGSGFNEGDTLIGSVVKNVVNGIAAFSISNFDTVMVSQSYPSGGTFTIYANTGSLLQIESEPINLGVLPVVLNSFAAEGRQRDVRLQWTTATEVNSAGFEIQRAEIGQVTLERVWVKAGYIEGAGSSAMEHSYTFTDEHLRAGKYAYRLKQIDRDGKFVLNTAIETEVGLVPKVFTLAQNYPNPFNPSTMIEFTLPKNGRAVVKVYNAIGQEVATVFDQNAEAGHIITVPFSASGISSGVYFYAVVFENQRLVKKMMLVK
ncbi:MAG: InlB B-repeat-containing protein, partial [Bacteroidota bacterium]